MPISAASREVVWPGRSWWICEIPWPGPAAEESIYRIQNVGEIYKPPPGQGAGIPPGAGGGIVRTVDVSVQAANLERAQVRVCYGVQMEAISDRTLDFVLFFDLEDIDIDEVRELCNQPLSVLPRSTSRNSASPATTPSTSPEPKVPVVHLQVSVQPFTERLNSTRRRVTFLQESLRQHRR